MANRAQHQCAENPVGFLDLLAIGNQRAPPGPCDALSLANRQCDRFKRAQMRKQRIDLIGAGEAALHPLFGCKRRDVLPAKQNLSGIRTQHTGHQIDQRRLAGAIRADQGVTRARRHGKIDAGGDDERAEPLVDAASGERALAHDLAFAERAKSETPPRSPLGNTTTTAIKSSPIQKYQYCGLSPEN